MTQTYSINTVNQAFDIFLSEYVNLDSAQTEKARSSRDWLISQIKSFPDKDSTFPRLLNQKHIFFGSFARRTKIRELDDIDIMIALSAEGSLYYEYSHDNIEITVPDSAYQLKMLCNDGTNTLNSRKVINKLKSLLNQVPQYQKAEMKRNQEAVTLQLKSYTWNYDLVPCFFTLKDIYNQDYYLIPNGQGKWKKTDPRLDRDRVTQINQDNDGNVLNVIRIMKYWNQKPTMPTISSYLLENMVLDFYSQSSLKTSNYVDLEIPKILEYIYNYILLPVYDPKNIQGNLNTLTQEEKSKIYVRAYLDSLTAREARALEHEGDHKASIKKWIEIFGHNFPSYT